MTQSTPSSKNTSQEETPVRNLQGKELPRSGLTLELPIKSPILAKFYSYIRPGLEKLLGLKEVRNIYENGFLPNYPSDGFARASLKASQIEYKVFGVNLQSLPKTGPLIVVANHPFGGIEGVILGDLMRSIWPDSKIMANFLLSKVPESKDIFIFVDPFGSKESFKKNIQPLKETLKFLDSGGVVGIFPAGTVSHFHLNNWSVQDPEWSTTVARLIKKSNASVLPVFFKGRNGLLFQTLGMLHPRFRTALLGRELVNKKNKTLEVFLGNVIPFEKLNRFDNDEDLTSYLRIRTYLLGNKNRDTTRKRLLPFLPKIEKVLPPQEPIIEAIDRKTLRDEVNNLPSECLYAENKEFQVYCCQAKQIPNVLSEIGRLREVTFRDVGEGTGKSTDLDRFDNYYYHLFIWNTLKGDVCGAYRITGTDYVIERYGKSGLYTNTLFNYPKKLLEEIGPALELGRSFVSTEYQKNYVSLMLLWKGIGCFVVRHKKYKTLFGPVSINNNFDSISRQLIVAFLQANNYLPEIAKLVKARNPLRPSAVMGFDIRSTGKVVKTIDDVSSLVSEIETEQMGVPILLKQYLKLGGKILGFNVDPDFGDVLDGLILVDLTQTEPKILERYLGKKEADEFLAFHRQN